MATGVQSVEGLYNVGGNDISEMKMASFFFLLALAIRGCLSGAISHQNVCHLFQNTIY